MKKSIIILNIIISNICYASYLNLKLVIPRCKPQEVGTKVYTKILFSRLKKINKIYETKLQDLDAAKQVQEYYAHKNSNRAVGVDQIQRLECEVMELDQVRKQLIQLVHSIL